MLRDINWLWRPIGLTTQALSNLFQTLQANKELNSPRTLSPEVERELALVEKELQDAFVDSFDPTIDCTLVFDFNSFSHKISYAERKS